MELVCYSAYVMKFRYLLCLFFFNVSLGRMCSE